MGNLTNGQWSWNVKMDGQNHSLEADNSLNDKSRDSVLRSKVTAQKFEIAIHHFLYRACPLAYAGPGMEYLSYFPMVSEYRV